ncbi:MAG TPA: protein kinase [Myxococcaceae bacterium]|nr:protein kinase [Myxococcaceae bacterium]
MSLSPGTLVAGRFCVRRIAGRGGMGLVYEAHDTLSGNTVALKLMQAQGDSDAVRRFTREAQVLAELDHPGIVSYVAHGQTEDGQLFLVMEWLEGEDLAQRLERQPLAFADVMLLLRLVSEVLAAAHSKGIVHRDIKPSNLFLCEGRVDSVKLLDFGLARVAASSQPITSSRVILGTPGYMAPEQVSHQGEITPAADIFSLGCVLYECLSRQPPFRAAHLAAVLAKILYADPIPLRALNPELPIVLQELVNRMLAKDTARRLADGLQLLQAVTELDTTPGTAPPLSQAALAAERSELEQQVVSVLLATPEPPSREGETPTMEEEDSQVRERLEPLLRELRALGGKAARLVNGSLLATFLVERGTATDSAALAGHCALRVQERWPESLVVLTTGLSLRGKPLPVGEAMDRAGELLRKSERAAGSGHVLLDATTAGLLEPRFQLDKTVSGSCVLLGEHLDADEDRPLLGRPTPCVGREHELGLLEVAFFAGVEDSAARALLVTAPAGVGKSRLLHEFLRRLERHGPAPLALRGRGDPMYAGSAYGVLGHALRRLCGVVDGDPLEARRQKLYQRVCRYLLPEQMKDTAEFLGELCAVPFPADDSPRLRAAREDPPSMSQQVLRAMVCFLRAELSHGPVLLVLEDLHWSDACTVRLVDELLNALSESPLLVLALARPEVKEEFPQLWPRWLQQVQLRGLSQKASARLVREVLGPLATAPVVDRLVEQAAGNALFLEELIRGVAEGRGEETPSTVLALLQSKLQRLELGPRRVLQAGAIFGRTFWAGGVEALVGEELSAQQLEQCLREVTALEVVEHQSTSRFLGKAEYRFRHALVRDAAYGLVPERLKPLSHRQAGAWLEGAGEQDPLLLAEHYQLGQDQQKAAWYFTRAAERLVERQAIAGAQRCLRLALSCKPRGELLVELQGVETLTRFWAEDYQGAYVMGGYVRPGLRPGSAAWGRVMGAMILSGAQLGKHEDVLVLSSLFLAARPEPDTLPSYTQAACFLVCMHTWSGHAALAAEVLERMEQVCAEAAQHDCIIRGWLYCARGFFGHYYQARPWGSRLWAEQGAQALLEVNSEGSATLLQALRGLTVAALGDVPRAVELMHECLESAVRVGLDYPIHYTEMNLALVLAGSAQPAHHEQARQLALQALETEERNVLRLGLSHLTLAKVAQLQGQLSEAEERSRAACELLKLFVPYQLISRTTLSQVLRAQGRLEQARVEAQRGVAALATLGEAGALSVGCWLALAEACFAQQEGQAAELALREASRCMHLRAADLPSESARAHFLSQVPENARVQALAREQWGAYADITGASSH